mgnify:CR=1 FL=1
MLGEHAVIHNGTTVPAGMVALVDKGLADHVLEPVAPDLFHLERNGIGEVFLKDLGRHRGRVEVLQLLLFRCAQVHLESEQSRTQGLLLFARPLDEVDVEQEQDHVGHQEGGDVQHIVVAGE